MRLYVGNLPRGVSRNDLTALFGLYGTVTRVEIPLDPITRNSMGFGIVAFYDRKDARRAARQLNGYLLGGRVLQVRLGRRKRFDG